MSRNAGQPAEALAQAGLIARTIPLHRRLSHVIRLKKEKLRPRAGTAPTILGRNQKAKPPPGGASNFG
jgi:hypothetical protein